MSVAHLKPKWFTLNKQDPKHVHAICAFYFLYFKIFLKYNTVKLK